MNAFRAWCAHTRIARTTPHFFRNSFAVNFGSFLHNQFRSVPDSIELQKTAEFWGNSGL
jgi:hypothetical protein